MLDNLADMGLRHQSFFGHVRGGNYGNALLSIHPLTDVVHTHLDGGTVVRTRSGEEHRIARGMLSASVSVLGVSTRVCVTHLDHMAGAQRTIQMRHVLGALGSEPEQTTLLVGDLNALSRPDYTADEWAAHAAHNAANGWGAPHDDAAAPEGSLRLLSDAGFVDCAATAAHRPHRPWARPPWTAHVRSADGPRYRIDYAWLRRPELAHGRRLVPLEALVDEEPDASDHQPLVVDVEAIAFDAGE